MARREVAPSSPCPCCSGATYGACCRRYHAGAEPETATRLMRSRYAAFALGDAPYIVRTLDDGHPDRAMDQGALLAAVRDTCSRCKFPGLRVLDEDGAGDTARVLFHARVFEKGTDRSFVELSDFRRRDGAWRYVGGEMRDTPGARVPETLTIAGFVGTPA